MSKNSILSRSVATLLALAPLALHAGTQTITASGDPTNGTAGANPSWGLPANWSGTNGVALPGVNDLAQINSDDFFVAGVDIRGSDFTGAPANFTEVQGISFIGSSFQEVDLENSSPDNNMTLALNGGGGTVPLIQTGNYAVQILGVGLGTVTPTTKTLTLQLKGSGDFSVGSNGLIISAAITQSGGTFGFTKTGPGTLTLNGTASNTYAGTTTINEGLVIANKTTGNAIGGNLVINTGGSFQLAASNQIADTATITIDGGTFGNPNDAAPPAGGPIDTVAALTVNSGAFAANRNYQPGFKVTGLLKVTGGLVLAPRGGVINAGSAQLDGGSVNLDGGSTSTGQESRLVLTGGLTMGGGTINFNAGPSTISGTSQGSIVTLGGNVTATGTNNFVRVNAAVSSKVDLGTAVRTFNIVNAADSLNMGTSTAPINVNGGSNANGSIIKNGAGTLSLNGTNSLIGAVTINGGTLSLNGSMTTLNPVIINNGAKFAAVGSVPALVTANNGSTIKTGDANGAGALSVSSLKLGVNVGDTETLNLTSASSIIVTASGGLTVNGGNQTVTINIGGAAPAVGLYTLIDYTGAFGAGINAFKLGTLPSPRLTAALQLNATNTTINLNVTGLDFPVWKGALSSEWSTATLSAPKNWVLNSNNATTTDYLLGDTVTFNDIATVTTVDVSVEDVAPSSMTFANAAKDYTIIGSKSIAGVGNLVKNGAGKLTINNTNSFTGTVSMNAGTVSVASLDDAGFVSPLGAGSSFSFNGGTLEYTGADGGTNRAINLSSGGGKVKSNAPLRLSGPITGAGTLTKLGNGTLVLTGANTYGGTTLSEGTLQVGDGGSTGSLGTGAVINNTALSFNRSDNGLTVPGAISGPGTVTQIGSGTTTLTGATANTYLGVTTVSAGTLLAGKTPGVNAIPGDLVIEAGGAFAFAGNNVSNQIADTATITVNGGIFGDPVSTGTGPTNPGATDTVANVTVNAGNFNSGRNDTIAPFTITGLLNINGGAVLAQRGGSISAGTINFSSGSLALDGGSGTAGNESKLIVGAGGLTLTNSSISLNLGLSNFGATSVGSIVTLNGNVTSTGTSGFVRLNPGLSNARIDLGGDVRTFNVTGTLNIGDVGSPIAMTNGGIQKTGSGALNLNGRLTLLSLEVGGTGVVTLGPHLGGPAGINVIDTSVLTINGSNKLDLTDNAMVVRGGSYAALYSKVASGFNGGVWNGPGINSSTAMNEPNGRTAVAIINNADAGFTDFAGVTGLTGDEILIKYTYYGDNDLSGTVTGDDFGLFLDGYNGASPASWLTGDYDYSGSVTGDDFSLFLDNYNNIGPALRDEALADQLDAFAHAIGVATDGDAGSAGSNPGGTGTISAQAAVPEPASAGLLAIGALGLLGRRRRR